MKRIKAACLEQTVHFQLKDDLGHAAAARVVKGRVRALQDAAGAQPYQIQIVEETVQPDDSDPHQDQKAIQPPRLRRLYGLSHSPPHPL